MVLKNPITNWNKYPVVKSEEDSFASIRDIQSVIKQRDSTILRGNGRSYGDASLGTNIISGLSYNKILSFDKSSGLIQAQSGILLSDILEVIVKHGWFLPVTPGTKFITLGGAVAANVHGKNHHVDGSFSSHVEYFNILLSNGSLIHCSREENKDLFEATLGGMGLTGVILNVSLRLKKIETSRITQRQIKARNLNELLDLFDEYNDYTYSVAWIDCLKKGKGFGRSILMLGEHSSKDEVKGDPFYVKKKGSLTIPFNFPSFALNKLSIGLFNLLYYNKNIKRDNTFISDYESFFYPLDALHEWNRIYGKKGFVQYQFVIPDKEGLIEILNKITDKGWGSFLAVLKVFGKRDEGIRSFPRPGYTLALDFAIKPGLFDFLVELDQIVLDHGGCLYLAKDARMSQSLFERTYPEVDRFQEIINKYNTNNKFKSMLSDRLNIING